MERVETSEDGPAVVVSTGGERVEGGIVRINAHMCSLTDDAVYSRSLVRTDVIVSCATSYSRKTS